MINDFSEIRECLYKDECYSVRDNGAIYRHQRSGKPKRPNDCHWTFGNTPHNGYLYFGGVPVHRIVATAFIGEPPSDQHVVDHIDTNRQNNRPENLRWLTKLENILNNEITRAKVEFICGSIEAFLENPSLLYNHESEDKNFAWMRAVTKEEAAGSLRNIQHWLKHPNHSEKTDSYIGDWIFQNISHSSNKTYKPNEYVPQKNIVLPVKNTPREFSTHSSDLTWDVIRESLTKPYSDSNVKSYTPVNEYKREEPEYYESLTPCAVQYKDWKTPTEFPQCPSKYEGLEEYCRKLIKGVVFSQNQWGKTYVDAAAISLDGKQIVVKCKMPEHPLKYGSVDLIYEKEGKYAHKCYSTFFEEIGAEKYFVINQGKEWTRGEVFDDFC